VTKPRDVAHGWRTADSYELDSWCACGWSSRNPNLTAKILERFAAQAEARQWQTG
jgi:hypothetical protein